jgi:NAD(P)-dependent dehydrogenase (short-subunit alcohol dehydrogenase family)
MGLPKAEDSAIMSPPPPFTCLSPNPLLPDAQEPIRSDRTPHPHHRLKWRYRDSLALGLAEHGATVILNGRNAEKLHAAAELLRNQGFNAEEARFDITDESEIVEAVAKLDSAGGVDVLVNNAGIQRRVSLEKVDLQTWNEVLLGNLTSAMLVSREVAKRMIQKRAGKIINICSLMSEDPIL